MRIQVFGRPLFAWAAGATAWLLMGTAFGQQAAPSGPPNPAPEHPAAEGAAPGHDRAAPKCDAACVRVNMDRAAQACARPIEAQAPIDYDWLTRPFAGLFQEADPSDDKSAVAVYRGDSIRFMNPQKEWVRVTYECAFDTDAHKVMGVRVRPGRLNQPPQVGSAPQIAPKGAAAGPAPATNASAAPDAAKSPQPKAEALAAAIAEAVHNRQQHPTASTKKVRIGEPSAIAIQQVNPNRAQ
ncbi:MAG: hypothetical protein ABSA66_06440 [Roseiarcus sp.]|jgi:hypothetical protein